MMKISNQKYTPSLLFFKNSEGDVEKLGEVALVVNRNCLKMEGKKPVGIDFTFNGIVVHSCELDDGTEVYSVKRLATEAAEILKDKQFQLQFETLKQGGCDILTITSGSAMVKVFVTSLESNALSPEIRNKYGLIVCHCVHTIGGFVDDAKLVSDFDDAVLWLLDYSVDKPAEPTPEPIICPNGQATGSCIPPMQIPTPVQLISNGAQDDGVIPF